MNLSPVIKHRYFTEDGAPLVGGKFYTYQAGTSTPQATFTDESGVTPNTNPIILDANGEFDMWLDPTLSYKFVLLDSADVEQWTVDDVVGTLTSDSVGTNTIQDGAVTTPKIADGAITPAKVSSQLFGPFSLMNYSLAASVLANELIIALRDGAGAAPSALTPVQIPFRDPTAATGTPVFRTVTSAITATVSSGSTLGSTSAKPNWIYVYAIDNSGTVELAFSASKTWDEGSLQATTADGGGGSADSKVLLYANNARSSKAVRLLGRIKSTQPVAGVWDTAPSEVSLVPFEMPKLLVFGGGDFSVPYTGPNPIMWQTIDYDNTGGAYSASTGLFTAPLSGVYEFQAAAGGDFTNDAQFYFTRNGVQTGGQTVARAGGVGILASKKFYLDAGDTAAFVANSGGASTSVSDYNYFSVSLELAT